MLEILVGLSIFTTALLLVFSYFPYSQRSSNQAKNMAIAQNLATEILERERALTYAEVGEVTTAAVSPPEKLTSQALIDGRSVTVEYDAVVRVTEIETNRVKDIVVTVSWREGQLNHSVVLETFKVQYAGLVSP